MALWGCVGWFSAWGAASAASANEAPASQKTAAGKRAAKSPEAKPAPSVVTIVTLGDSITRGVRSGVKAEETFSALLESTLLSEGIPVKVTNVGVGGERTDGALKRLDKAVLALKPNIVIVMYGTNDSYVDSNRKVPRLAEKDFYDNTMKLVERLKKARVTTVLMTEPSWGAKGQNGLGDHPDILLGKFMERTREVARKTGVPVVDNFAKWQAEAKKGVDIGKLWTTDQCHPNPIGHFMINEEMLPVVRKLATAEAKKLKLKVKNP